MNALGLLVEEQHPRHPGPGRFAGRLVHTNAWPADLDITGKRVGVIGTGSTGTQFIVAAAPTGGPPHRVPALAAVLRAVRATARWTRPRSTATKENFDAIWDQVRNSVVAFGFQESGVEAMSVSEEERQRVFQENWDKGNGFRFMFGTFCDIATDPEANAAAAAFIRSKIAEIVDDPETAPQAHPDRPLRQAPAVQRGLLRDLQPGQRRARLDQGEPDRGDHPGRRAHRRRVEHELDVLVFATGFDAVDGNYRAMDLRGRGGRHIDDHWTDGPTSYLGVSKAGFPNMFMILGPNGPFTNLPPSIEAQVEWIGELIGNAERDGRRGPSSRPGRPRTAGPRPARRSRT